jgi:hypothetical protein
MTAEGVEAAAYRSEGGAAEIMTGSPGRRRAQVFARMHTACMHMHVWRRGGEIGYEHHAGGHHANCMQPFHPQTSPHMPNPPTATAAVNHST